MIHAMYQVRCDVCEAPVNGDFTERWDNELSAEAVAKLEGWLVNFHAPHINRDVLVDICPDCRYREGLEFIRGEVE